MRIAWILMVVATLTSCGGKKQACATPADCTDGDRCVNGFCVPITRDSGTDVSTDVSTDTNSDTSARDTGTDTARDVAVPVTCGNGDLDAEEECDDGTAGNSDTVPDACRTSCLRAFCGDGVIDTGEACDDTTATCDGCAIRTECVVAHLGDTPARVFSASVSTAGSIAAIDELTLTGSDSTNNRRPERHQGIALCGRIAVLALEQSDTVVTIRVENDGTLTELMSTSVNNVTEVACEPDGSRVYSMSLIGSRDIHLRIWNLGADGALTLVDERSDSLPTFGLERAFAMRRPATDELWVVAAARDEVFAARATLGTGGVITRWDRPMEISNDARRLEGAAFSPNGRHWVMADDQCLRSWDPTSFPPNEIGTNCGVLQRQFSLIVLDDGTIYSTENLTVNRSIVGSPSISGAESSALAGNRRYLALMHGRSVLLSFGYQESTIGGYQLGAGSLGTPFADVSGLFAPTATRGVVTLPCTPRP